MPLADAQVDSPMPQQYDHDVLVYHQLSSSSGSSPGFFVPPRGVRVKTDRVEDDDTKDFTATFPVGLTRGE